MKWLVRNIALAIAMAAGRRLWHAYRRRRTTDRAGGPARG